VRVCLPCAQLHRTDAPYDEQVSVRVRFRARARARASASTDAPYDEQDERGPRNPNPNPSPSPNEQDERGPAETREASAGLAADLYARMRSSALSVAASGGALAKSAVQR